MLMRKLSPLVPFVPKRQIRADIIKIYHDTPVTGAHFGRDRTTSKIKQRYFWPSMINDIKNHVQSCLLCAQYNPRRCKPPGALKPIKPPSGVWQLLTMDFHGPITPTTQRGNKYIISLTDVLSKFVITRAVRDCMAETAARFIKEDKSALHTYKQLCCTGKCIPFQQPSSHHCHHIHHRTSIETLDELIDRAHQTTHYTIDTENQLRPPPQPSQPVLIQIQFVHLTHPPTVLLIEVNYLPSENSPADEIRQPELNDIQDEFRDWFHSSYPPSDDQKSGANDQYSLQSAIYLIFTEWLEKRMTLANWGCGIDLALGTYIPSDLVGRERYDIIKGEEELRLAMKGYAINDCFAGGLLSEFFFSIFFSCSPFVACICTFCYLLSN
ncbi:unnamed protein product [Didymodactylos carnosus]|uniref:Integrase zinc-binding domain-containing protein n=1 Tax=Didymodactylos carnosus TaxID=1234261 RepID=A0A8S2EB66_9BILA|nr:unnamed protein product [Didymodactylos carnosus]CAF3988527.1 unnamed protein product [Didymodactylos carnosus]